MKSSLEAITAIIEFDSKDLNSHRLQLRDQDPHAGELYVCLSYMIVNIATSTSWVALDEKLGSF
jgi:hypothetical protein